MSWTAGTMASNGCVDFTIWTPWIGVEERKRYYSNLLNQHGHILQVKWAVENGAASQIAAAASNTAQTQRYD
jgi:hypothetical protein